MELRAELIVKIFFFDLLLFLNVYSVQEFSERPQHLDVIQGQTAVMKCAVENRAGNIQWGKGSQTIIMLGFARNIPGYGGRYSVIGDDRREYNLQIVNTKLDDDDDFHCQVGPTDTDPRLTANAHLTVLVPPDPPEIEGHTNGSVVEVVYTEPLLQLVCKATNGRPAATLKWFRNDVEIVDGIANTVSAAGGGKLEDAINTLTITPKYPKDNNVLFTCQAFNNALINGPLRSTVFLSVLYPPSEPKITGYKHDQAVRVNDTVSLTCTSEGGNPLAQVAWFRNNAQVDFSYTTRDNHAYNDLVITAERSDNDAEYRCDVWNQVNAQSPLSITRKLVVQFAPTTATITGTREAKAGEMLTLTCTTSNSNPAAVVTWIPQGSDGANIQSTFEPSPDGGFITISEINITLSSSQTNAVAVYTCSATNHQLGVTVADTASVGVLYPPEAPQITGYFEGEAIRAGNVLKMRCTALRGNPPATLMWFKDNETVTEVTDLTAGNIPSLEIAVLTKPDDNGAIYKCTASNRATITPLETSRILSVHFPPTSVTISSEPVVAKAGYQLHLTCVSGSSNPPAVITWVHNSQQMPGNSLGHIDAQNGGKSSKNVLQFTPKSVDHDTAYGCQATNLAIQASVHDAITLNVRFKPEFRNKNATVVIKAGESRILDLTAMANPTNSSYILKRDSIIINPGDIGSFSLDAGVLTVSAISKDDAGHFIIVATNAEGTTSFNFTIDVQYVLYNKETSVSEPSAMAPLPEEPSVTIPLPEEDDENVMQGKARADVFNFLNESDEEDVLPDPAEIYDASPVDGDAGTSVTLRCLVRGNPMVPNMVTWKRDEFDMTRALPSYEDGVGSLLIESLEKTDSGSFTCIADNGIGTPIEQVVELTVKFIPEIDKSPEFNKAASQMGRTGKLVCKAEGAPTVTFKWQKDGVVIEADTVKYEIEEKVTDSINYENALLIKDVQKSDYGMYHCIVTNEKGEDTLPIVFDDTNTPSTKPDPPYDVEFVNATHNSITIRWNAGFDGGMEQSFRVRYKVLDTTMGYTYVDVQPPDATLFTVKGLSLGTEYELTVMAHNSLGGSDYAPVPKVAKTSNLKPTAEGDRKKEEGEDMPVIIILVVCVVGIFLLALNIGLILFFVRRRKKRMENGSDTTSHSNTIELYGPTKETQLYPMTPSDESRSYGTNDKYIEDDYSDDYKSYEQTRRHKESCVGGCMCLSGQSSSSCTSSSWKDNCCFDAGDEDLKRVFLPPPEYGGLTYSHNNLDSPTFDHRHPIHTEMKSPYNGSDTDSCRKSPWQYEADAYKPSHRGKGTFDSECPDTYRDHMYEMNGRAGSALPNRPKSVTELSERSSAPSSRKTPPPPPLRSSSKGAVDNIPPLPARNYDSQDAIPRYVPPPGSSSSFNNNVNVIPNPSYEGPSIRTPSPRQQTDPTDDMRGYLV